MGFLPGFENEDGSTAPNSGFVSFPSDFTLELILDFNYLKKHKRNIPVCVSQMQQILIIY